MSQDLSISIANEAYEIRSKIKSKQQGTSKRSLKKRAPLKTKKGDSPSETVEDKKRQILLEQLEGMQKLPQNSSYARHRKACLQKALTLLELTRYPTPQMS